MATLSPTPLPHPSLWRADEAAIPCPPGVPTGHAALDTELPGGGWPPGEMTELLTDCSGHGELSLLLPLLVRSSQNEGWIAWVAPPHIPGIPALASAGLRTPRLLIVRASTTGERAWALRQALRSDACTAVVGWLDHVDTALLRRLQLAVRETTMPLLLFRSAHSAHTASPAALRLQLSAGAPGVLRLDILKRWGRPASRPLHLSLEDSLSPSSGFPVRQQMAGARIGAPPAQALIA
ncbi:MAG TPA: translesion DNA synthesis-associated protein ImuA [Methyloversatilis sp.]